LNPFSISTDDAQRVAFVSSEPAGGDRWTELAVYYWSDGRPRPWMTEARGRTTRDGERDRVSRLPAGSLERSLKIIDDTDMGVAVKEMAREFAAGLDGVQRIPDGEREALAWLFGVPVDALSVNAAGEALGVGESTMRAALAGGRPVKVSLRALLPFINRDAFLAAQAVQS